MAKKVKATAAVAAKEEEASKGCKNCNNTGLIGKGVEAKLCPICNGSPFGEPK